MKMEEVDWSIRAENCGVSTVAVHGPGVLSPSLYNDRCPWFFRQFSSRTGLLTCPCYARQVLGLDVQKTAELPQLQFANQFILGKSVEIAQAQFLDVELSMPTVEVPQIQFLAVVCLATETCTYSANCAVGVRDAAVSGGVYGEVAGIGALAAILPRFSRSSRLSGVERQFLELSMAKSSLPSRAPLHY